MGKRASVRNVKLETGRGKWEDGRWKIEDGIVRWISSLEIPNIFGQLWWVIFKGRWKIEIHLITDNKIQITINLIN